MKQFLVLIAALSVTYGQAIIPSASQFHAQDALGQYSYGYAGGPSAKVESKTLDGVTRGGYSYIDANGLLQSVNYVADPFYGFRVAATNLPEQPAAAPVLKYPEPFYQDLKFKEPPKAIEYAAKPIEYPFAYPYFPYSQYQAFPYYAYQAPNAYPYFRAEPKPEQGQFFAIPPAPELKASARPELPKREYFYPNPADLAFRSSPKPEEPKPEAYIAPNQNEEIIKGRSKRDIPALYYAPLYPSSGQFEIKDNLGQYTYGYHTAQSSKTESRQFDGSTNGAYSYVDPNGNLQAVHYTADQNGFRVAATNLP